MTLKQTIKLLWEEYHRVLRLHHGNLFMEGRLNGLLTAIHILDGTYSESLRQQAISIVVADGMMEE